MDELENDLKASQWLGILTYDAFKYAAAGGSLEIRLTDEGLTLALVGVFPSAAGLNKKFRRLLEASQVQVNDDSLRTSEMV